MTKMQKTLAALLVSSTALTGLVQAAEVEANVGATSDYIWRGMTQNSGNSSISGGIDVDYGNGLYAGTWVGDVDYNGASYELDLYAGYAFDAGGLSYDVGYLAYMYPDAPDNFDADGDNTAEAQDLDFSEFYLTVGKGPLSLSYYFLASADGKDAGDDTYTSIGYETELGDWGFAASYGIYDIDGDEDANTDLVLALSKEDFTFSVVSTEDIVAPADEDSSNDDDLRVTISWGTSF
jgi:uncharacterized protein (TIGR02001 family)